MKKPTFLRIVLLTQSALFAFCKVEEWSPTHWLMACGKEWIMHLLGLAPAGWVAAPVKRADARLGVLPGRPTDVQTRNENVMAKSEAETDSQSGRAEGGGGTDRDTRGRAWVLSLRDKE
jgi:hypothetical protein